MSKLLKIISNTTLIGILGLGLFTENSKKIKINNADKYVLSNGRNLDRKEVFDFYESIECCKKAKVYRINIKNNEYIPTTKIIYDFGDGDVKEYNSEFIFPKN